MLANTFQQRVGITITHVNSQRALFEAMDPFPDQSFSFCLFTVTFVLHLHLRPVSLCAIIM
jgi:hypothetical protein